MAGLPRGRLVLSVAQISNGATRKGECAIQPGPCDYLFVHESTYPGALGDSLMW